MPDLIQTACGICENSYGRTIVRFDSNGKGSPAQKLNMVDVQNDVEDVPQISFPVNGIMDDTKYLKDYVFVPILESPGVAFITLRNSNGGAQVIMASVFQCWPVVLVSMLLAYLSGALMWAVVCGSFVVIFR